VDELEAPAAASARKAFKPRQQPLPVCNGKTPFLCDALGKGQKNDRGEYPECLSAPELQGLSCRRIKPIDLGCLPTPPPAASCTVPGEHYRPGGEEGSMGVQPGEPSPTRDPDVVGGFNYWAGRFPSVSVYLVLDPATRKVTVIRDDASLAKLFAPVDAPGKALQLLALRASASEWRAVEPRGGGFQAWVLAEDTPFGCGRSELIQTSAEIDRSGKLSNVREVVVEFGV
jgi:hypothetical protein